MKSAQIQLMTFSFWREIGVAARGVLAVGGITIIRGHYYAPTLGQGALSDDARLTFVCRVHWA